MIGSSCWFGALGTFLGLLLAVSPLRAIEPCHILNVYHPDEIRAGRSVSIELFPIIGIPDYDDEPVENLRIFAAEKLESELQKTRYFETVDILADNQKSDADFHIKGEIGGIHEGSRWRRAALASGAAEVRMPGSILLRSGEPLADFECLRKAAGGLIGAGGLIALAQSDKHLMQKNISKFAESLAKAFSKAEKEWAKRTTKGVKDRDPMKGKTESVDAEWRQQPLDEWKLKQHSKEVRTFVVQSDRPDWYVTQVLWLNSSSFRSNDHINNATPNDGDVLDGDDLGRGFLLDLEPVRSLFGDDVYVLAATFNNCAYKKKAFFWDPDQIREVTYLTRADDPDDKVVPVKQIDLPSYLIQRSFRLMGELVWRAHPVVFAFPTKRPDGSPLVVSLDDEIEFHSHIDGHDVIARFRIQDFQLSTVDELRLNPDTEPARASN